MVRKKDIALALMSGILLVFGFPPFDFYPLSWFALVPLLMCVEGKQLRGAFSLGTLTGFVYFAGTIYWIFNSVYFYGNVPVVLSLLLVIVLCLYLGVYIGIFSVLLTYLSRRSRFPSLFLVPVLWVTLEFLRTYALTGFPWSILGYTQYKILPLIQIADITGVYGISFLLAAFNGAVFDVAVHWPKKLDRMPLFGRWPMVVGLLAVALIIIASLSYGMWKLRTEEQGQKMIVSVIQGNFEQEKKWT